MNTTDISKPDKKIQHWWDPKGIL